MNIVFGAAMTIATLFFAFSLRMRSKNARTLFTICMAVAVLMFFSAQTFGSVLLTLMTVVEVALCGFLVFLFRTQLLRDAAAEKARSRKASRAKRRAKASARVCVCTVNACSRAA